MSDKTILYAGNSSPQAVALELMREVAFAEKKELLAGSGSERADRAWILSTYAECYRACTGHPYTPKT